MKNLQECIAMVQLKKTLNKLILDKDYSRLGVYISVIQLMINWNLMEDMLFDEPFCDERFQKEFLTRLASHGFHMTLPAGTNFFNTDPKFLAAQYPDVDFAEISFAWWTTTMETMDATGIGFNETITDHLLESLETCYNGEKTPAVDVLETVASDCPIGVNCAY